MAAVVPFFSLTEEDDHDEEDLLTDEDAMSQDKEEEQLWPDMCSPCRPFFKYHGPGPDQGSPGAMAICHVVVAEKDEGESKRGGWGCRGVGPVLVTKVDKPQRKKMQSGIPSRILLMRRTDFLTRSGKNEHRDCTEVLRRLAEPLPLRPFQRKELARGSP